MNTVSIKINGMEYNLKGREDNRYMLEIAAFVDGKFKEISANNNKLGTSDLAVLSAINITDEYFKLGLELDELNKKKSSLEERHGALKERLKEIKLENDESLKLKSDEIERLKNNIVVIEAKMKDLQTIADGAKFSERKLKEKENINSTLLAKIANLEKALADKNEENKKLMQSNVSLKSQLDNKVVELSKINMEEVQEKEAENDNLKEQLRVMEDELKGTSNEKESLKARYKEMKFQLQNSRYKVLDLEKKLIDAQFDLALEKKSKNPLLK